MYQVLHALPPYTTREFASLCPPRIGISLSYVAFAHARYSPSRQGRRISLGMMYLEPIYRPASDRSREVMPHLDYQCKWLSAVRLTAYSPDVNAA